MWRAVSRFWSCRFLTGLENTLNLWTKISPIFLQWVCQGVLSQQQKSSYIHTSSTYTLTFKPQQIGCLIEKFFSQLILIKRLTNPQLYQSGRQPLNCSYKLNLIWIFFCNSLFWGRGLVMIIKINQNNVKPLWWVLYKCFQHSFAFSVISYLLWRKLAPWYRTAQWRQIFTPKPKGILWITACKALAS